MPLTQLVRIEESTGPSTIQRDWGERRIIVQTNVRGRDIGSFVKEAQERIGREVAASRRLHHRMGRAVRASEAGRTAALCRRAAGTGPDPQPALSHVPLAPRRRDDFQRRALRPRRRHPRPLCHGPAVFHLRRCRFRRPGRCVDPGRADPCQCHPRPDGPRRPETRGHRAGPPGQAQARADDGHRGRPGIRADDARHRHRCRSAAAAGDRRRLRHGVRYVPDDARPSRALSPLRKRSWRPVSIPAMRSGPERPPTHPTRASLIRSPGSAPRSTPPPRGSCPACPCPGSRTHPDH